jgi:DNA helicase-2/ATP-dependent DNA helicase PcrA
MPTERQLEAIHEIDHNLQIIACAGSGKTDVLAFRVAEILAMKATSGIAPKNIVAFTYNDRAAAELKDRITAKVVERLKTSVGLADMYVGTIHGFCLRLLQTYVPQFLKYNVLSDVQSRLFVDRYSARSGLQDLRLKRYAESGLFLSVMEMLREAEVDWKALADHPAKKALQKYDELLDQHAYFDYAKMQAEAVKQLNNDEALRRKISLVTKYVLVDEYQDVNPLQEKLISTLHELGANICVVGDDDQSIYQWRGTDVDNIIHFADRYPEVHPVTLDENFRSSSGVVDCARYVIERNDPHRLPKHMISANEQSFQRGDVLCRNFESPEQEAFWIAEKIRNLIGTPFKDKRGATERGLARSDFAILLRSVKNDATPILQALEASGLKYVVKGMTTLFETLEVQAACGIFMFIVDQVNEVAIRKLWEEADVGLTHEDLDAGINSLKIIKTWKADGSASNLQRIYLNFLGAIGLQEERISQDKREVVYYNLGKFSQVISDYEQIHFLSDPKEKCIGFVDFLLNQAPGYYPEGWEDIAYVVPNAVQVMTVHQAKGQQWPVVFVPALQDNRFPSKRQGGKGKWHVVPKPAIAGADRYDGGVEDERRLFYVALTRSKKYLYCTWAPRADNQLYRRVSPFFDEATDPEHVLTREPARRAIPKIKPQQLTALVNVSLSFSDLKYYFECPYQFKLRFMYGFNPPIDEALGYGKSLHDALAEVHRRALDKDFVGPDQAEELVDRHLHVPFAYPQLKENLRRAAVDATKRYLQDNGRFLDKIQHSEQIVEIHMAEGVVVNGRIDLIRRTDTNETIVVDFKSTKRAQDEDVTRKQLHIYAKGYEELVGHMADLIEIHNLDRGGSLREEVDVTLMDRTAKAVQSAGKAIQENRFPRQSKWSDVCSRCDPAKVCRKHP